MRINYSDKGNSDILRVAAVVLAVVSVLLLWDQGRFAGKNLESKSVAVDIKSVSPLKVGEPSYFEIDIKDLLGEDLKNVLHYSGDKLFNITLIHDSLKFFARTHPEDYRKVTSEMFKKGEFPFVVDNFPKAGYYLAAVNFKYRNEDMTYKKILWVADGVAANADDDFSNVKTFDGYTVSFGPTGGEAMVGIKTTFKYKIEKAGIAVDDLSPMRFSIVSSDFENFAVLEGPVSFDYIFPAPGAYAVFGEFQDKGKTILTKFMVEAK